MKKIRIYLCVIFIAIAFPVMPCLAKTFWNANSVWPPKNNHSAGLVEFSEKARQATKGELTLAVRADGTLGYKGPELLKVVRDGLVPVSDMLISGVAGDEEVFQVVTLPFLVRDIDELRTLIDIARPFFDKTAESKWQQKILYTAPWPGAGLWTKKKVTSVAEMKGLRTRTYDLNGALIMEAVGATPSALPFSEVSTSLRKDVIDSVMTSTPTAVDIKFWDVLKYYQPLNITIATNMVTVNLAAFRALPEALQTALVTAAKEIEEALWTQVKKWDKSMETLSNKNGIETVKPSPQFMADLEKVTAGIRGEWLKTAPPAGKDIYAAFTVNRRHFP